MESVETKCSISLLWHWKYFSVITHLTQVQLFFECTNKLTTVANVNNTYCNAVMSKNTCSIYNSYYLCVYTYLHTNFEL